MLFVFLDHLHGEDNAQRLTYYTHTQFSTIIYVKDIIILWKVNVLKKMELNIWFVYGFVSHHNNIILKHFC